MELIDELLEDAKGRMGKSVESSRGELATVRSGRASPHLLDRIVVDYYGAQTPLKQLANVSASDARLLTVTPFDKSSIGAIEKSIQESDVGLTPSNDRSVIRLRVRDFSGAIADVDQSIQRWPQLSEPYVNRGAALINLERPQEALAELDKAIAMGLEKVHLAYYNRGLAKEKMNDARGAYADYRKALELDPNFTLANEQLQRFLVNGMRARS